MNFNYTLIWRSVIHAFVKVYDLTHMDQDFSITDFDLHNQLADTIGFTTPLLTKTPYLSVQKNLHILCIFIMQKKDIKPRCIYRTPFCSKNLTCDLSIVAKDTTQ